MKLSCPTNSPGAYADSRARCSARSNGARSSCLMAVLRWPPSPRILPQMAPRRRLPGKVRPRRPDDLGGAVRASPVGPATGLIAQLLLLGVLAATAGLGGAGWIVGVACAVAMTVALARGLARRPGDRLGPASWVTLARATLAIGIAALVAASFTGDTPVALLVTLAVLALALDLADGWVARRTATESALGASFDGEVDAFLILSL